MRKQIRTITGKLLVAGLLVTGLTTGASVYAANAGIGVVGFRGYKIFAGRNVGICNRR